MQYPGRLGFFDGLDWVRLLLQRVEAGGILGRLFWILLGLEGVLSVLTVRLLVVSLGGSLGGGFRYLGKYWRRVLAEGSVVVPSCRR